MVHRRNIILGLSVLAACLLLAWPLLAGDALDDAPSQDALGGKAAAQDDDPIRAARRLANGSQPSRAGARLYLFITLDAPMAAQAIRAGRALERRRTDIVFEPVLLADLELLQRLKQGEDPRQHARLYADLQALSDTGESLPMVGMVPLARRFQIKEVPSFVLLTKDRAHKIAGLPDLAQFVRATLGDHERSAK